MKKTLGIVLSATLIFSGMVLPVLAVDTTTSATVPAAPAPTAPAPAPKAPTGGNTPAQAADGSMVYSVVSGDTFSGIAWKNNTTVEALAKLNPHIKDINWIYVGDKIILKAAPAPETAPATATGSKLYHGFGEVSNYRFGHTSLNTTTASVIFDESGKIVKINWDVLELAPAEFPNWADEKMDAAAQAAYKAEVMTWQTKKELGAAYGMKASAVSGKEWFEQIAYYENYFKGKTVDEVKAWVQKYTDGVNHRPYKMAYPDKLTDADKAAVASFTDAEKKMLVDVTTGATMSLSDDHSKFVEALEEAAKNKVEIK